MNKLLSVLLETDIRVYYCCYAVLLANAYSAVCDVNVGEAKDSILVYLTVQYTGDCEVWVCHSGGPPFQRAAIPGVRDSGVANQMSACGHPRSSSHVDDKKHASKLCDRLPEE